MKKECFKCHQIKPLDEFYIHKQMADGHLNKCKDCAKKDSLEREKELRENPLWRIEERTRGREKYYRLYRYKNGSGSQKAKNDYAKRYPIRKIASSFVGNAIRDGRLKKEPCEICGKKRVHAHHDDYYKPMEVRWLCIKHHNEYHVKLREKKLFAARLSWTP